MTTEQREKLEHYIVQIGEVADRAEKLKSHVDAAYRKLLDKEVKGYRELIVIWRKRLKDGI
jgi:hypothetical protein